jgi:hypothetical protein
MTTVSAERILSRSLSADEKIVFAFLIHVAILLKTLTDFLFCVKYLAMPTRDCHIPFLSKFKKFPSNFVF